MDNHLDRKLDLIFNICYYHMVIQAKSDKNIINIANQISNEYDLIKKELENKT